MIPPNKPSVGLLLPVWNEIDGLTLTLPQIDKSLFDEITMVDGGSTDGSVELAKQHNINVIRQKRPGLAFAVYDAIKDFETEYVIEFSPDGNCLVEDLPRIVEKICEGYDVVVVSRYLPPAKSYDDNLVTSFGNWVFTLLIRHLGKHPITDALTMYRGFRRDIVFSFDFQRYLVGPVFEPLISALANLHNLRICEIPGDEPKRIGGYSKMRVLYNGFCIINMILRLYYKKHLSAD